MPESINYLQPIAGYSDALTLGPFDLGESVTLTIDNKGPAIFQLARKNRLGRAYWDEEEFILSGTSTGFSNVCGIRFRQGDPSNIPTIVATLFLQGDAIPTGSVPFIAAFSSTGSIVGGNVGPAPATTLPATPVDGQQAILVDSVTVPSYVWFFQWDVAAARWIFLGGSPIRAAVSTAEVPGSANAWINLATIGPQIVVPRAGTYLVRFGTTFNIGTGGSDRLMQAAIWKNDTGAQVSDPISIQDGSPNALDSVFGEDTVSGLLANDTLRIKYQTNITTVDFRYRKIEVTPVVVT